MKHVNPTQQQKNIAWRYQVSTWGIASRCGRQSDDNKSREVCSNKKMNYGEIRKKEGVWEAPPLIEFQSKHFGNQRFWVSIKAFGSTPLIISQSMLIISDSFFMYQFSSVAQSCPTLWDPMYHNTPALPVHHQLPEFTQTHVHRVSDAIQPSHPLLSPSPPQNKKQCIAMTDAFHKAEMEYYQEKLQMSDLIVVLCWPTATKFMN